jgi:hypothetical protein
MPTTTTTTAEDMSLDLPPLLPAAGKSDDDRNDDDDNEINTNNKVNANSNSNDDDDDTSSDDSAAPVVGDDEAAGLLTRALALKEEGNAHFTKRERELAARCYRRGLQRLKRLRQGHSADDVDPQVAALHVTLATNLATVLYQKQQYGASVAAATQALAQDAHHVKALYRRAVALRKMGDADAAKADLVSALALDAHHAPCRKEYKAVVQSLQLAKEQQQAAMRKAFNSNLSLYDDKEAPAAPPTAEELLARQKQAWEDDCVARMAKGVEHAVGFDDWQREQREAADAAKRAAAQKDLENKADQKRRAAERKATAKQTPDSDSSGDDLTPAELAALRGYKKTKDGRITSYFTREVADAAPAMGPQKLSTSTTAVTTTATLATSVAKGPSAWNRAGTWEEKDCTNWCLDRLRSGLEMLQTGACRIAKVDEITGDASIVWASGQQRHVFDLHASLHYSWKDSEAAPDAKACKGVVKLPEITSTTTLEGVVEVVFENWKRAPKPERLPQALADRQVLAKALQDAVQAWLQDFHEHYKAA